MSLDSTPTRPRVRYATAKRSGLPPDLLERASKRLGWAALLYSCMFFLAVFGIPDPRDLALLTRPMAQVSIACIAMGVGIYVLSRFGRLRPETLLDMGLVFEVVGAVGIAWTNVWGMWPEIGQFDTWITGLRMRSTLPGIPWECFWILVFPLIVPCSRGKAVLASTGAASAGPAVIVMSKALGATAADVPVRFLFGYYLFSTYLCAAAAVAISWGIYRYGRRLAKAEEVGSYRLSRLLGHGGMGEVWVAEHQMLARPAAIKLIRSEAQGAPIAEERFRREAQATALLRSKHTVDLYDFGVTEDGYFYYVMELLDGLDLATLVERFGPLPPARVVHLLRGVCHSLGEAHAAGLIHRDLKPANIFTCRLGPDADFVKVLDFGLVKSLSESPNGPTTLTDDGATPGTPDFMAPEAVMGADAVDGRADLYALGCVAYWLLTGQTVFAGATSMATRLKHVQDEPIPPSQRTDLPIPADLEELILACLAKDPANRPQTAEELEAGLSECSADAWRAELAKEWWKLHVPPPGPA